LGFFQLRVHSAIPLFVSNRRLF